LRPARVVALLALAAALAGCRRSAGGGAAAEGSAAPAPRRIVVAGATVTEIAFALGAGAEVVAVDTSSVYPSEARSRPKIGYQRTLAAEGVLAQRPTLLLLSAEAGPPRAIEQLRGAGVPLHVVPSEPSIDGAKQRIRAVAAALGAGARGDELARKLDRDAVQAAEKVAGVGRRPKVLFIYARGAGTLMVAGTKTPAEVMIRLAGGENAVTGYEGYKPIHAEEVAKAAPAFILIPSSSLEGIGGEEGVLSQPGVSLTPAGAARAIVVMDDVRLLGFGPRTGEALLELFRRFHAEPATANAEAR
jgi:iron complex transport system substrate-binding protein